MKSTIPLILAASLLGMVSCTTIPSNPIASEATQETFTQSSSTKGIVILAVNWGRRWGCGKFENAEIMSIGFDRLPLDNVGSNQTPDLFIDGPPRLFKDPVFIDYALVVEPGAYALTSFDIKVARSVTEVGHYVAGRSELLKNGKPVVGSFDVKAGEVVYIGNFFLDCNEEPMLWRYYTKGIEGFKHHMNEVKQKYPFIDPNKVDYRLFQTKNFGQSYELPQ